MSPGYRAIAGLGLALAGLVLIALGGFGVPRAAAADDEGAAAADDDVALSDGAGDAVAGDAAAGDAADGVVRVLELTGDDVYLRSGPSIDHHDVGRLSRGDLVLEEARDGDFVRVRVPGGVALYVFAALLDWDGGALRCKVAADDVLMRATPTTGHYPLYDQKLQRGTELVVIGTEDTSRGRWLRVVSPPDVHVWIHARYVRVADPPPAPGVLAARARARLDVLSGGRTREERERLAAARRAALGERLRELTEKVDGGAADTGTLSGTLAAARRLALDAGDAAEPALRARALALVERITGLLEEAQKAAATRAAEAAANTGAQAERERAAAQRRQQELEELRRHREAQAEAERRRRAASRGAPAAAGIVRVRAGKAVLEKDGAVVLELRSRKFRLADYVGKRVRLWGHRQEREDARDRLEVTSLEVLSR